MLGKFMRKLQQSTGVNVAKAANDAKKAAATAGTVMDHAKMSDLARGIAKLNMNWQDGSQSNDDGSGRVLRNWEVATSNEPRVEELYVTWDAPAQEMAEYIVVIGWKGWAIECLMKERQYFSPNYVQAFVDNQLATVRTLSIAGAEVPQHCLRLTLSPDTPDFYYLKLVGKTSDGSYVDIPGAILSSAARRQAKDFPAIPEGNVPSLEVPADGSRDPNDLERDLVKEAAQ